MFLSRLQIENVRSIDHLDLAFGDVSGTRQWTLVLGENGTGKTTILKSAALVLAGSTALAELLGNPDDWIQRGRKTARIRAEMVTTGGEQRTAELVLRRGATALAIFEENRASLSQLDAAISHTSRSYITTGYGVSRRQSGDARGAKRSSPYSSARARNVATLFSSEASLTPLESWAMDLDYRKGAEGIRMVRASLNKLLPGVSLLRIDRERRELLFKTPDGTLPYRLLSDGYQNVASWVGDLLARFTDVFEDYKRPLEARGLLLIDEVDLHLDPTWQRELQRFLTQSFPNLQLICTTHSPLTAHQTSAGELYVLSRRGRAVELEEFGGAANTLTLDQFIASPVFGVDTLDSVPVERLKDEYRELVDQRRTPAEDARLAAVRAAISALPYPAQTVGLTEELGTVLRQIEIAAGK